MKKLLILLLAAVLLWSCGSPAPEPEPAEAPAAGEMPDIVLAELVDPEAKFSPLRYLDSGLITLNDRCPVREFPLNLKTEEGFLLFSGPETLASYQDS
ncbi:MAG: hypothetical protein IFK94_00165 [Acidobacteria bacterium]|uniref:Uncharacterized protein n=1 Tax=Candidatus Polarisedimenticola svalbardensis TaxID=2886004 RepID=A0A8J6XTH9_9BACT|nr:hypothetical protein [Candidatus Polarisedimenticola svalbardensis]